MNDAIRAFLVITLSDCIFADHIGYLLPSHGEFRRTILERWEFDAFSNGTERISGPNPAGVRLVPQGWY